MSSQSQHTIPAIPTSLTPKCHPLVDQVVKEVHDYYLQHWSFKSEEDKQSFLNANFPRFACLYFPAARNDRIGFAARWVAYAFLIDDLLEDMSFRDGSRYVEQLMPLCRGRGTPDDSLPASRIVFDLWKEMRAADEELTDDMIEPQLALWRAQTHHHRAKHIELKRYFDYRQQDFGKPFLSALLRFTSGLHLPPTTLSHIAPLDAFVSHHLTLVNDICSYTRESQRSQTGHHEGAALCTSVQLIASETGITPEGAKKVLWALCREFEAEFRNLKVEILKREGRGGGDLSAYLEGLEDQISGNEKWSLETGRYVS